MADVVRYWRSVELFSPQTVPGVKPAERVFAVHPRRPLPWEPGADLPAARPRHVWQHTVYCGVFEVKKVRDVLAEVFPDAAAEDHDGRIGGDSALMSFTVNEHGRLLQDSVCLSTCAWAVGRTRAPGPRDPRWLEGFADESAHCERTLLDLGDGRLGVRGGGSGPGGLLAVAGTLVADAVSGGVVTGLTTLATGAVGRVLHGVVGDAAQAAVGEAVRTFTTGAVGAVRGTAAVGTDGPDASDGSDGAATAEDTVPVPAQNLGTRPVTFEGIAAFTAWLADRLGVTEDLVPDAARVKSVQVREDRADEAATQDFLNSFIAEDLDRVAGELDRGRVGRALEDYLTSGERVDAALRRDVRGHPEEVLAGVAPELLPLGRWPSASDRPLVLSQQFAVNRMLAGLDGTGGVFSVNGPPGTGKTTLLRDVIAALITRRACALAELDSPQQAFGTSHTWRGEQFSRTVRELRPQLTGYEMVVASANNGAVENITNEIPAREAVAEQWHGEASYLADQARLMLGGEPAWGAVAARLGNRRNRNDFAQSFWWGNLRQERADGRVIRTRTDLGLRQVLSGRSAETAQPVNWAASVQRFQAARREVERLRAERQRTAAAIGRIGAARSRAAAADARAEDAAGRLPGLLQRSAVMDAEVERLARAENLCRERRRDHEVTRPGFFHSLFTGGRANRTWQAEYERLTAEIRSVVTDAEAAQRLLDGLREEMTAARRLVAAADTARTELAGYERKLTEARARWGDDRVPDPESFTATADPETVERREKSAPWADEEFVVARTRLFLEALRLHEAFLRAAGPTMLKNLDAAMEVVTGDSPKNLPPAAVRAAWQTFFLAVPVVSTTFASYDRLFAGLGREAVGWLFVDEAGQAAPQMPVGALWRSRRALLLGDPLQLEPVVVLPWKAQQRLREHHGVAQEWAPAWTSAQQVADRLARWGTTLPASLPDGSTQVWVGSPLRVHRRCDDPMFTVSNTIAYDGLMVHGVADRGEFAPPRDSFWWHVRSTDAEGKWVRAEGRALTEAVRRLLAEGLPSDELFVLSPFREVARGAAKALAGLVPSGRIGTVHTAQGKESDVVILVLGTHPDAVGSRRWAAAKPNLLNVAVSRAKRRLLVIGDHDAWGAQNHFSVLAAHLRRFDHQPRPSD